MLKRLRFAIVSLLLINQFLGGAALVPPNSSYSMPYVWADNDPRFGGWSAIETDASGTQFQLINDKGFTVSGRFVRSKEHIVGITYGEITSLKHPDLEYVHTDDTDSEGLAWLPNGDWVVSFENRHKLIETNSEWGAQKLSVELPPLHRNRGIEALAASQSGELYFLPEHSGTFARRKPVYKLSKDALNIAFYVDQPDAFLPVGADFGPDGALYILERGFNGFVFRSRISRIDPCNETHCSSDILFETAYGQYDNFEGIAVWQSPSGVIWATLISDDNFRGVQQTQLLDVRLN